uniref:Uncharacterized protein n=1 Tax=Parascaris univalens TaxID=6257 RepID=A0A915AJD5_PARUN
MIPECPPSGCGIPGRGCSAMPAVVSAAQAESAKCHICGSSREVILAFQQVVLGSAGRWLPGGEVFQACPTGGSAACRQVIVAYAAGGSGDFGRWQRSRGPWSAAMVPRIDRQVDSRVWSSRHVVLAPLSELVPHARR